ncbi:hypothetical protein SARC_12792 [Sphaeroforma arctica JP610]|uniref:Uncharacterized protein n=1 Tax=Sphaeroforma arctica JP610 TaxID=667725 RepID=A0A0L0FF41_9EUKA|nr:hypothetical protein SARC_12792 [Sphaeroforma arctica JP610]KNC74668.1 hypothetical protein SARC_12792 [Sphaeroforma arctica JP610]|eukprot:XP_014148570.1 hypothetical protein SARC_12792 [Sphaeroforma arctica JP610]
MKMPIDDGKADTYVVGSRGDAIVVTAQHRDDIQAALAFNAQARQVLSQYKNDPSLKESREMTGTKEWKNTIRRVIDGQGVRAFAGDKRLAEVRKACIIEMAQTDIGEAFSQRFDKTVTDFLAKNAQAQFLHSSKTTTAVEFVKKYIAARDAGNEEKKKPGKGSKSKAAQKENDRREWLQVFHEIRGLYDDFDRMDALDCSPLFKTWTPHDKVLLLNDYELFQAKDEESLKDQMKLASRLEVYYNLDNNVPSGSWFTAKAAHQEQVEFVRQLLEDPHKLQRWFIAAPDADVVLAMRVFFANRRAVLDQLDIAF